MSKNKTHTVVGITILVIMCAFGLKSLISSSYMDGQLDACRTMYDVFMRPVVGGECKIVNDNVCLVGPMGETICLEQLKQMYL